MTDTDRTHGLSPLNGKLSIMHDLWNSVDKLGSLITAANWGIAITLLVAFACTAIAVKATSRKDELTRIADLAKAQHIAELDNANLVLRGQVATLEINASTANKDLASLQKDAADAKAKQQLVEIDLAKQQEKTAMAEQSLLELQQTLADRSLSDTQLQEIRDKLKGFPGQEYTVTAYWDSKESLNIANRVHEALQLAHWKYVSDGSKAMLLGGLVGIKVFYHPDADENTKKAAQALIGVLSMEGIQAVEAVQNPVNNPKHNRISLSVGSKR